MKAGIALGSNLGQRTDRLGAARDFLFSLHTGKDPARSSALYETEPVDCAPGTAPFLNAVVEIETRLEPQALAQRLREFEQKSGRSASRNRNSPREIDLDLLYAGASRLATPDLTLPHPRMTSRRFVLQPLADIQPDFVLPGQTDTVAALLAKLPSLPAVQPAARQW